MATLQFNLSLLKLNGLNRLIAFIWLRCHTLTATGSTANVRLGFRDRIVLPNRLSLSVNVWPLRASMLKRTSAVWFIAHRSDIGVCLQHLSQSRLLDPQTTAALRSARYDRGHITRCRGGGLESDSVPYRMMSLRPCHILSLKPSERVEVSWGPRGKVIAKNKNRN